MSAPTKDATAVVPAAPKEKTELAKRTEATVQALRERNAMVAQIRGTQWGLGIDSRVARAVAHYCLETGLDPVRHVEVLGGKIYLTAEFYEERAAPFIRRGEVIPHEPEFINVDPRLDTVAQDADAETAAWAKAEKLRRMKARIEHNAPEAAIATCVRRCTIAITGKTVVGVNWCGGGTRKKYKSGGGLVDADPIGDLEPTKTSITRAGRRMWKQVADVIQDYGRQIKPIEARAEIINEGIEEAEIPGAAASDDTYENRPPLLGSSHEVVSETVSEKPREIAPAYEPPPAAVSATSGRMRALLEAEKLGRPLSEDEQEDLRQWHADHPA